MSHIAGPSRSGRSSLRQQTTPPRDAATFQIVGDAHAAWYRDAQANPVSGQALTYPLAIFVLVYNLVRVVMLDASERQRVPLDRVSFVDAFAGHATAAAGMTPEP